MWDLLHRYGSRPSQVRRAAEMSSGGQVVQVIARVMIADEENLKSLQVMYAAAAETGV